ncbi:MAG: anti-sigma factor family protein [Thermodesulfobacteriota bacterium]
MTCPYDKWLSRYMDGELSEEKNTQIRIHMNTCDACRREFDVLAGLDARLRSLPEIEPSEGFERAFWKKVAEWEESRAKRKGWAVFGRFWSPVLAGALAMAVVVLGIQLFSRGTPVPSWEEMMMAEQMEFLLDYDLVRHLEMLENWEAINQVAESS